MPSLPVRGAWVEMSGNSASTGSFGSLPVRGAWVEMHENRVFPVIEKSLPVRGAWVEIAVYGTHNVVADAVAPRAGSVG